MRHDADQHETAASQRRLTAVLYSPHMATKTRTKKSKATLDSVLSTVERGFADLEGRMERGFAAVANVGYAHSVTNPLGSITVTFASAE
jgi:hypothetical protein